MKIQRGDILFANLGRYQGSVQGGNRPVVVISNNKVNRYSTVITVVPLSTKVEKKKNLPRCGRTSYILGKLLSCGISGGVLPVLAAALYLWAGVGEEPTGNLFLLFLSGMFWAIVAATLAAAANSHCVAYGGAFVLCYVMVILYERYFQTLYCLYPVEWYAPEHTWILGDAGIVLMLSGLILLVSVFYYEIVRRCMEGV